MKKLINWIRNPFLKNQILKKLKQEQEPTLEQCKSIGEKKWFRC